MDFRRRALTSGFTMITVAIAAACGGDSNGPASVSAVAITSLVLTVQSGSTITLTATAYGADSAEVTGRKVTWTAIDPGTATVSNAGVVTGVDNGVAQISATIGGVADTALVRVYVGMTGVYDGAVTAGGNDCPLTMDIVEDLFGDVTGTGTLDAPCSVSDYTIAGSHGSPTVADTVVTAWTGTFNLDVSGKIAANTTFTGLILNGGCTGTNCPFTLTRTGLAP